MLAADNINFEIECQSTTVGDNISSADNSVTNEGNI
jgi:hypothetical protein